MRFLRSFFRVHPKIITSREKRVVLENFISLTTLQGLSYVLPLAVLPYLVRVIGPERFGLIAFAQAFVQYFMIITDYGFSLSATRKISLCGRDKGATCAVFSSVLTVKLLLAGVCFLALLAIINFVPKFRNDWQVYALSFGAVVGNTLFPVWFFQGKERMVYIAGINIVGGIFYVTSIFLFVNGPSDYLLVPLFTSLFFLATGISGLYIAFRKFGLSFVFQRYRDIQQELRAGWDIFISVVAINAYTTTRVFAVGLLTNNVLTGYYSVAERVAGIIQSFPIDSLSQALYPRLTKIFVRNKARAAKLMRKIQRSVTFAYLITLPAVFFGAPLIAKAVCGKAYPEVILTLRALLLPVFLVAANAFRVQFLLVSGRPSAYSRLHLAAALIGLPLIFILTRFFSYLGAAWATALIEAGVILWTIRLVGTKGA